MKTPTRAQSLIGLLLSIWIVVGIGGCGFNDEPQAAEALWTQLQQSKYKQWTPVPGFATPQPAQQPFTNLLDSRPLMVTIYMNDVMAQASQSKTPLKAWPMGALLVKEAFQGDDKVGIVAMQKRKDGWFWVQWNPDGSITHSGEPADCIKCHQKWASDDMLATVPLPR